MATTYTVNRHSKKWTRDEILKKLKDYLYVYDADISEGRTLLNAESIGFGFEGSFCEICFSSKDVFCRVNTYGRQGPVEESLAELLEVELISEHEDEFPYHDFPVDVRDPSVKPVASTPDGYELYEDGGFVFLYYKPDNLFYPHVCERVGADINALVENIDSY